MATFVALLARSVHTATRAREILSLKVYRADDHRLGVACYLLPVARVHNRASSFSSLD